MPRELREEAIPDRWLAILTGTVITNKVREQQRRMGRGLPVLKNKITLRFRMNTMAVREINLIPEQVTVVHQIEI